MKELKSSARWIAMNLCLLLGVFFTVEALTGSVALARRRFPLFIIISNNPWLMGLGIVLVGVWFFMRNRGG